MKVLVVDDEELARNRLMRLLKGFPDVQVVGACTNGREAVGAIRDHAPDLVFLDIQMPEMDGFDVVRTVGAEHMPLVVFVTAYDQYALQAFDVHALDYLLKPFDKERFALAFDRARRMLGRRSGEAQTERLVALLETLTAERRELERRIAEPGGSYLDRVMIKSGGRIFFVRTEEVDWVEAAGNYVRLHVGRASHLIRETMTELESRLDPSRFVRIHRSTIVNLDRIKEMRPWFAGEYAVILEDGKELRLSRGYREKFAERLGKAI